MEGYKAESISSAPANATENSSEISSESSTAPDAESQEVIVDTTSESKEDLEVKNVREAYAEGWEHEQQLPEIRDYLEEKQEYTTAVRQWDEYLEKASAAEEIVVDPEEFEKHLNTREEMQRRLVEVSANYPGDNTSLLYRRISDPLQKARFIEQRLEAMESMIADDSLVSEITKPKQQQSHYQTQIDNYDARVAKVFSVTNFGPAQASGKASRNVGVNIIDEPGTLFTDATQHNVPLTTKQLNILEAHEKGHGFRDFESPAEQIEIRSIIDQDALDALLVHNRQLEQGGKKEGRFRAQYVSKPEEIIERMAQFKNYFGMGPEETFSKKHLEYIREHYIADTGLDNGISDLLTCVTPKTESAFLAVINKYPI